MSVVCLLCMFNRSPRHVLMLRALPFSTVWSTRNWCSCPPCVPRRSRSLCAPTRLCVLCAWLTARLAARCCSRSSSRLAYDVRPPCAPSRPLGASNCSHIRSRQALRSWSSGLLAPDGCVLCARLASHASRRVLYTCPTARHAPMHRCLHRHLQEPNSRRRTGHARTGRGLETKDKMYGGRGQNGPSKC
jgi:hypothetical protein